MTDLASPPPFLTYHHFVTIVTSPSMTRVVAGPLLFAGVLAIAAVGCGTTDEASRETLPPLVTTTSSTVPQTTDPNEGKIEFYEIKAGESIAIIAAAFQVPPESIIELNNIENPDTIQVGQILQIPTDVVLVDELPTPSTTELE